jgi:hypothetical protein
MLVARLNNLRGIFYSALRLGLVEADAGFQRGFPLARDVYIYSVPVFLASNDSQHRWRRDALCLPCLCPVLPCICPDIALCCPVFVLHLPCAALQGLARLEKAGKKPPASAARRKAIG